ncbi:MAG: chromate transporter [Anaerovoracaceae bacterium]
MKYIILFWIFFKVGAFSFGGGLVMLPIIFQNIEDFGIMTVDEFSNLLALSQVTPGAIAVNAATYVGLEYAGLLGGIIATLGVVVPSYLVIIIAMHFLDRYKNSKVTLGMVAGIRPATVGLIGAAAVIISNTVLIKQDIFTINLFQNPLEYVNLIAIILSIITIILTGKFKVNPMIAIVIIGLAGGFLCG